MSRIGKKPVAIPAGVTITTEGSNVTVKGPKGELSIKILPEVTLKIDDKELLVERVNDSKDAMARHGLTRQLIHNMVVGVSDGFTKQLEIIGVGYKAQAKGKVVDLSLGFSHPVLFPVPDGIEVKNSEENKNVIVITGIDKQLVGQVAANIRSYRPPEPYKGKGIKYVGELIQRKAGKTAGKGE